MTKNEKRGPWVPEPEAQNAWAGRPLEGAPPLLGVQAFKERKALKALTEDAHKVYASTDRADGKPGCLAGPDRGLFDYEKAVTQPYAYDFFATPFILIDEKGCIEDYQPRVTEACAGEIERAGGQVMSRLILIDADRDPHEIWKSSGEAQGCMVFLVDEIRALGLPLFDACTTRRGARLAFLLSKWVRYADSLEILWGLLDKIAPVLLSLGFSLDETTGSWGQVSRLPGAVRESKKEDQESFHQTPESCTVKPGAPELEQDYFFRIGPFEGDELDPETAPRRPRGRAGKGPKATPAKLTDLPMPTLEEARALVFAEDGSLTEYGKAAKKAFTGSRAWGATPFSAEKLKIATNRHFQLLYLSGIVASTVAQIPDTDQRHVFAVLSDWAASIPERDPRPCGEPPEDHLWKLVLHSFAAERGKRQAEKPRVDDDALLGRLERAFPCQIEEIRKNPELFLSRNAIVSVGSKEFYVFDPEHGVFDGPCSKDALPRRIEDLGLQEFVPTTIVTPDAPPRPRPVGQIIRVNSMELEVVETRPTLAFPQVIVYRNDLKEMVRKLVRVGPRLRTDLPRMFNPFVDKWVKTFSGPFAFELQNWIAYGLDFQLGKPTCALALYGNSSTGKKLLLRGLAECFTTSPESAISIKQAFGEYNDGLRKAALIYANEGLSAAGDVSEAFRQATGGDGLDINKKFGFLGKVYGNWRIVMTFQRRERVLEIAGGSGGGTADIKALAERLLVIEAQQAAADYLESLGGLAFTGRDGGRWIAPDNDSSGSNYVVASHFLWLHENFQRAPAGHRFQAEGSKEALIAPLSLHNQDNVTAGRAIALVFGGEKNRPLGEQNGVLQKDGRLFISPKTFQGLDVSAKERVEIMRGVDQALELESGRRERFAAPGGSYRPKPYGGRDCARLAWREIDLDRLSMVLRNLGYEPHKLKGFTPDVQNRMRDEEDGPSKTDPVPRPTPSDVEATARSLQASQN